MSIILPNYTLKEVIYQGRNSLIFKAFQKNNHRHVIIKLLNYEYPTPSQTARFQHEFNLTKKIHEHLQKLAIQPVEMIKYKNSYALVLEDFEAVSLADNLKKGPLNIDVFLHLAIKITDIIGQIHSQNILIKDINPANILWNTLTDEIKIIDFGISTTLSSESFDLSNTNAIDGTLSYISPEQTGRMNRVVDYRSDYYSLGITFYEMLVGTVPFQSHDAMELVHAHMAKIPSSPAACNSEIPTDLANIILKLLNKMPEKRYQSTKGLLADLQEAEKQWKNTQSISIPILGTKDISSHFKLSEKLYGRENEIQLLLESYQRVSQGSTELILISGIPGVGKSALAHEIHKPIAKQKGFFISGKFDQFKRNIPLEPVVQAFKTLIQQILTDKPENILEWTKKIQNAVGQSGKLVLDVIPEVKKLIGEQPDLPAAGLAEIKNRFVYVFRKFIQTFASEEHPLTIFLDDLQWADSPSLDLINHLLSDPNTHHLQIIGAFRSNEVDEAHLLKAMMKDLEKQGIAFQMLHIPLLDQNQVIHFLMDTFNIDTLEASSLADLCYSKTRGSPFFLNQLIQSLYQKGLVYFDFKKGNWSWKLEEIKKIEISENVVEFLSQKIIELPENTQNVLQLASCLGSDFNLETLALIAKKGIEETSSDLWIAMEEGLIIPKDANYKFVRDDMEVSVSYHFLHDRVQQAAYSLIPESKRNYLHFQIGTLLLNHIPSQKMEESIFSIVNQLNLGLEFIVEADKKKEIIKLNLLASTKAKASSSFKAAIGYLKTAINFLDSDAWKNQYQLTFNLFKEYSSILYIVGEHEIAKHIAEEILQHAQSPFEKAQILGMQVSLNRTIGKMEEAIQAGIQALSLLGIDVPRHPSKFLLLKEYLRSRWLLGLRQPSSLINLPTLDDPTLGLISSIIHETNMAGYYTGNPNLTGLLILKKANLAMSIGNYPGVSIGYLGYAMILTTLGKLKEAYQFAKLALDLCKSLHDDELKSRIYSTYAMIIHGWNFHWKTLPKYFEEAIQAGLESGDLITAQNGLSSLLLWDPTLTLQDFAKESDQCLNTIKLSRNQNALDSTQIEFQFRMNLLGKTLSPFSLSSESFDEAKCLKRLTSQHFSSGLALYYKCQSMISFYYGDYLKSLDYSQKTEEFIGGLSGSLFYVENVFYTFYIHASAYPMLSQNQKKRSWKTMQEAYGKVKKWAAHCPVNFLHHLYLMQAEWARLENNADKAFEMYDKAIAAAQSHEFIRYEALANELAGKFALSLEKNSISRMYFLEAHYCYQKWGAVRKVAEMEKAHPNFFKIAAPISQIKTTSITDPIPTSSQLDLISAFKSTQAIAREIMLPQLIQKMLHVVIENAGAQKGLLLINHNGDFLIEAIADEEEVHMVPSLAPTHQLPLSAFNYVRETKETLIISNAAEAYPFQGDPYINQTPPKSLLCTPLLNGETLKGAIYLENNLLENAFTPENLKIIDLLTSQMAISIDNAYFYSHLEDKIKERTKKLIEAQTRLAKKEKMAFLGMLATGIAHEIKNPLNFIINFTELSNHLLAEFKSLVATDPTLVHMIETLKHHSSKIYQEGKKADEIVNRVIEHSSAQNSEHTLCHIQQLIETSIEVTRNQFLKSYPDYQAKIIVNFDSNLLYLNIAENDIKRVLCNLLKNAFQTTEQKKRNLGENYQPTITIETKDSLRYFQIKIKDNGKGIGKLAQESVFTPFFTTKSSGEGIGLGLSLCYNIIEEEHGGKLTFESHDGEGTEFMISIPHKTQRSL